MKVESFNQALRDFARKHLPAQVAVMERKVCLEGLRRLVEKTPVDTGRARGGWQVGIAEHPRGQTDRLDDTVSADESPTVAAGSAVIAEIKMPVKCIIANNVEYIEALENGHSQQAPNGMLGLTVQELGTMFK